MLLFNEVCFCFSASAMMTASAMLVPGMLLPFWQNMVNALFLPLSVLGCKPKKAALKIQSIRFSVCLMSRS